MADIEINSGTQSQVVPQLGPWVARGSWILDVKDRGVAEVHQTRGRPSAQEAADIARVLAAAPDMLSAMRLALAALPDAYVEGSKTDAAVRAIAEAFDKAGVAPISAPTEAGAGVAKPSGITLERIPRKVWDSMGGVNNPDLMLRHAKRGPDRHYIVRRTGAQP